MTNVEFPSLKKELRNNGLTWKNIYSKGKISKKTRQWAELDEANKGETEHT